jgi:hypothetical protein
MPDHFERGEPAPAAARAWGLGEEFKRSRGAIGTRPDRIDERLDRSAANRSG